MGTTRSLGFIWKRKRFSSNTLRFRIVFSRPRENELVTGNGAIFDGSMGIYWYPTPWRTLRTDVVSCIGRIKQTNYATGKRRNDTVTLKAMQERNFPLAGYRDVIFFL